MAHNEEVGAVAGAAKSPKDIAPTGYYAPFLFYRADACFFFQMKSSIERKKTFIFRLCINQLMFFEYHVTACFTT
jgi:hypothetical protein